MYREQLTVSVPQSLALEQVDRLQLVYEQYTSQFGHGVGRTRIASDCTVLSHQIGIDSPPPTPSGLTLHPLASTDNGHVQILPFPTPPS